MCAHPISHQEVQRRGPTCDDEARQRSIRERDRGRRGETIEFLFPGRSFAIDLSSAETAKFGSAMSKYLEHAREVAGPPTRRRGAAVADARSIRGWARQNGLQIPERGRVRDTVAGIGEYLRQGR